MLKGWSWAQRGQALFIQSGIGITADPGENS